MLYYSPSGNSSSQSTKRLLCRLASGASTESPYRSWTVLTLRCSLCRSDSQTFLQDRSRIVLKALPCESPLIGRAQEPEGVTTCLLKRLQRAKDPKSGVSNDLMCILHAGVLVYSCVLLWLEDLARLGQGMGWYGAKIGADVQQGHSKNQDKEETGHSGGHRQHADASATRFWHRFKIALPAANMVISHHLPVSTLTIRDLHLTRKIWKIYRSQSCTSVHIGVNSLSNSCYYNPHRQITNCWITSLAILWPVSASLHRPLPRR